MKKALNKIFLLALLAVAVEFSRPAVSFAVQAILLDDAYTKSTYPTSKFGTKLTVVVSSVTTGLLHFDLSSLPAGVTSDNVKSATLTLFARGTVKAGTFKIMRVAGAWLEPTVTHNTVPALGATEVTGIAVAPTDSGQFISIDLTTLVQDWVDG
ncbi:MAG: DNRLRE domain-containing protein, partial [Candidatus Binatia bacterium]